MIGRLLLGATVALAAAAAGLGTIRGGATSGRVACGVERWTVKTLQDRPALRPARPSTVRFLVTRRAPLHLPASRLPFETSSRWRPR